MRNFFLFSILLVFLLLKPIVYVYGQSSNLPLPGVNCGIANDEEITQSTASQEKDAFFTALGGMFSIISFGQVFKSQKGEPVNKCCTAMNQNLNDPATKGLKWILDVKGGNDTLKFIGSLFTNMPGIGLLFSGISDNLEKFRTSYDQLQAYQKNNPGIACVFGEPNTSPTDSSCICKSKDKSNANKALSQMCYTYLSKSNELGSCVSCASGGGMWTAIGCIPTNTQGFITTFLLSTGIGLGGIIALMCIIYAAFSIQTSRGNPEKIKKAQELITSCIMGLILIIFSVFILRLIGVNILRIPFLQ